MDLLITTSQNPAVSSIPTYKFEGVPDTDSLDIMNAIIRKLRIGRKYKGIIERFFSPEEIRIYQKEIIIKKLIVFILELAAAKEGNYDRADELIKEGDESFVQAHHAHIGLLQEEVVSLEPQISLLMVHAEDQLMGAETIKTMVSVFVNTMNEMRKNFPYDDGDQPMYFIHAIRILCSSNKDRSSDFLKNIIMNHLNLIRDRHKISVKQ